MLRSWNEIEGYELEVKDGEIGKVKQFYFDYHMWILRYFVVDTGRWLPGRQVLISPTAFGKPDFKFKTIPINLTKEQIENSPGIDFDKPISRQEEIKLSEFFSWPKYWLKYDSNLRSSSEIIGYNIAAKDGEIGDVDNFIVDDQMWFITYLVIDTSKWLPAKKVLVHPNWIEQVSWRAKGIFVNLNKESIKNCPEYNPYEPVNREYEIMLFDYHGKPQYWIDG